VRKFATNHFAKVVRRHQGDIRPVGIDCILVVYRVFIRKKHRTEMFFSSGDRPRRDIFDFEHSSITFCFKVEKIAVQLTQNFLDWTEGSSWQPLQLDNIGIVC